MTSTAARFVVGPDDLGTPESEWLASAELRNCPRFEVASISNAVIIAPHPDDEVLALGGLMRILRERGAAVSIVAATDGEASHPRARLLAQTRAAERVAALARLHSSCIEVTRLRLPDGEVGNAAHLGRSFERLLSHASHCFAPWQLDGHPDHDACGRAAELACHRTGVALVRYPVWAWHWTTPTTFPWATARRIELDRPTLDAKLDAISAYRSQIAPFEGRLILPPKVLARFQRAFEVVLV